MEPMKLPGGIEFYSFRDTRFKQGALSIQFIRPMKKEEAALNALLPAVLLRGCKGCPDLRTITLRLDDLYGASVSALVRRVGDYQVCAGWGCHSGTDVGIYRSAFAGTGDGEWRILPGVCGKREEKSDCYH